MSASGQRANHRRINKWLLFSILLGVAVISYAGIMIKVGRLGV